MIYQGTFGVMGLGNYYSPICAHLYLPFLVYSNCLLIILTPAFGGKKVCILEMGDSPIYLCIL